MYENEEKRLRELALYKKDQAQSTQQQISHLSKESMDDIENLTDYQFELKMHQQMPNLFLKPDAPKELKKYKNVNVPVFNDNDKQKLADYEFELQAHKTLPSVFPMPEKPKLKSKPKPKNAAKNARQISNTYMNLDMPVI